jgi:hypothetical protein
MSCHGSYEQVAAKTASDAPIRTNRIKAKCPAITFIGYPSRFATNATHSA